MGRRSEKTNGLSNEAINARSRLKPDHAPDSQMDLKLDSSQIDSMSTVEVLFHLLKLEKGEDVIGDPRHAFASFDRESGILTVYEVKKDAVRRDAFGILHRSPLLFVAQEDGATFTTSGNDVVCVIGGVCVRGRSYEDAALRALFVTQSKAKRS